MECKKCSSSGTILLRKKDSYCNECFITNTNHKFRACIGKNKILTKNEKVLICLSGGLGSIVLLDLINSGICMDNHNKKLRILPIFLHLIGSESDGLTVAQELIKQCNRYNFEVHLVHMYQFMNPTVELPSPNSIAQIENATEHQFTSLMKSLPPTINKDFINKIRRSLFIKCAKALNCSFIFTGETTTQLASNLLSNLAMGRGSQVEHDIGFNDARNKSINIIRPMKEINQDELNYYSKLKNLSPVRNNLIKDNSLQSVIGAFVIDLQENFPATIPTVCKTADKIGIYNEIESIEKCVICESNLSGENSKLTALAATKFSRTVSNGLKTLNVEDFSIYLTELEQNEDISKSLFPHINKHLCYGCSRNYSETVNNVMPNHIQKIFH